MAIKKKSATRRKVFAESHKFVFNRFPYTDYDAYGDGGTQKIRNLLKRFAFGDASVTGSAEFVSWTIRDEDTPQTMAHRLYNSTHYDWILLLYNEMFDPDWDWPMQSEQLAEFISNKYGVGNELDVHHYVSYNHVKYRDGIIVDSSFPNKSTINNSDYELALNESKRDIQILPPEYLPKVLDEFNRLFENG